MTAGDATPKRSIRVGTLLAVVSAAAFATLAVLGRFAIDNDLRPNTLLQWRFGVAALVLAVAGAFRSPMERKTRILLLVSGLIYTLQTSFYFGALERISAGTTALLLYLAPVFVVLYARLLGRRPSRLQLTAVAIGVVGLAVIVGLPSVLDADALGLTLGAAAGATFAGYVLAGEMLFAGVPALVTAAHTMTGAAVGFLVADLLVTGRVDLPAGAVQWAIVAATVVVPTLVAIPTLFASIARIGAGPVAVISNVEPVCTLLLAAAVLSEPIGSTQVIGGGMILAAAYLAQRAASAAMTLEGGGTPPVTRLWARRDRRAPEG